MVLPATVAPPLPTDRASILADPVTVTPVFATRSVAEAPFASVGAADRVVPSVVCRLPSTAEVPCNEPSSVVCWETHKCPVTFVFPRRSSASSALLAHDTLTLLFAVSSLSAGGVATPAVGAPVSVSSEPPTTVLVDEAARCVVAPACVRFPARFVCPSTDVAPTMLAPPEETVRPSPTVAPAATPSWWVVVVPSTATSPPTTSDPEDAAPLTASVSVLVPPVIEAPSDATVNSLESVNASRARRWPCTVVSPLRVTPDACTDTRLSSSYLTAVVPSIVWVVPDADRPSLASWRVALAPPLAADTVAPPSTTERPPSTTERPPPRVARPEAASVVTPDTEPALAMPALLLFTPWSVAPCATDSVPASEESPPTEASPSTAAPPVPTDSACVVVDVETVTPFPWTCRVVVAFALLVAASVTPLLWSTLTLALALASASAMSAPPTATVSLSPSEVVLDAESVVTPDTGPAFPRPAFALSMPFVVANRATESVPARAVFPPTDTSELTPSVPSSEVFPATANPCVAFRLIEDVAVAVPPSVPSVPPPVPPAVNARPHEATSSLWPPGAVMSASPAMLAPPATTVSLPPSAVVLEVVRVVTPETSPAFVMLAPRLSTP